jgi:DNA helicase HerA-like ATPase
MDWMNFKLLREEAALYRLVEVGVVETVSGVSATCRLDRSMIEKLQGSSERCVAKTGAVGSNLKFRVDDVWIIAEVTGVAIAPASNDGGLVASLAFLGEGSIGEDGRLFDFSRGVSSFPRPGDKAIAATHDDLVAMFNADDRPSVEIGAVYPTQDVRAPILIDPLLTKHFAIFGSTGTGKSTLVAYLLQEVIKKYPAAHIVLIDPHGEYSRAFPSTAFVYTIGNLKLPHWMMNFQEHCEALITSTGEDFELDKEILAKCLLKARALNEDAPSIANLNVDTPIPYAMFDLLGTIDTEMGKLEKLSKASSYLRLKIRIEDLMRDKRFSFMFGAQLYSYPLTALVGGLLRMPNDGKPISIIDLSNIPSEIVSVAVALISRVVFDYAMWSRGEELSPVLLLCEEAQRYLPSYHIAQQTAAKTILQRIAKEGRKYGVSLGIVCQRPSDLSETVLSQSGTVISTRLNNLRDQDILRNALPDSHQGLIESIQSLRNRECIISGEAVSLPVRVRIDDVPEQLRPHSDDPVYSELWKTADDEKEKLERIVARWVRHAM